jgi:hypothetical protein
MTAPQIRPQTPNLTFPAVSGFIDTSLNYGDILIELDNCHKTIENLTE